MGETMLDYAIYTRGYNYSATNDYIPDYHDVELFKIWQQGYTDQIRGKMYPTADEYYGVNYYAEHVKFGKIS